MMAFLLFFANLGLALSITMENPVTGEIMVKEVTIAEKLSVGEVTIQFLESLALPYKGDVLGFSSLLGVDQHLEILSSDEMKAYGWCFSLDGIVPETLTDVTMVTIEHQQLRWFYAFAHYKQGVWLSQCEEDATAAAK
jgi:hypothetical protein